MLWNKTERRTGGWMQRRQLDCRCYLDDAEVEGLHNICWNTRRVPTVLQIFCLFIASSLGM
jgi:hypothetical protein